MTSTGYKVCGKCLKRKRCEEFAKRARSRDGLQPRCRMCTRADTKDWKSANPERASEHKKKGAPGRRLRRMGLTPEEYATILIAQGGRCATCKTREPGGNGWHIDHDHACCPTGRSCGRCIRGILCLQCNIALGMVRDSRERLLALAAYLERTSIKE